MDQLQKYKSTDKMMDLISDNYALLQVMSRFGVSLGFGDKTVKEVCEMNGVDSRTFLVVVNFMAEGFSRMNTDDPDAISIPALVDYLRQAHTYFLDFCLPAIRRKLLEALDYSENDVSFLILKFFDEYMHAVRKHMEYENKTVFTYVDALLQGKVLKNFQISTFSQHHDQVGERLTELKNIIIKYCPSTASNYLLHAALFDIYACEEELESHSQVEDLLFVPAILKLERRVRNDEK
ncbi:MULTISPECIES: hemerythrin domain-containing protein [Bacteroides]|uniref:hemerythrin domain-containing protein n=1 Tax=Bacteroides TaxID=816 RepID=UPI0004AC5B7D|nr:hemerythrin domain-containing protein [Bacteroides neonati]